MISIIIASIDKVLLNNLLKNIESTIGIPFEILAYDNMDGKSIASIYNEMAAKAQFAILCFTHEDVIFKTSNWGEKLLNHFIAINNIGLIGVAGSTYKTLSPSGWFADSAPIQTNFGHFLQQYKHANKPSFYYDKKLGNANYVEVRAVDGFWLCTTKEIWKETKFDEAVFNQFHCYDIDFSLNVGLKHKIVVVFDIMLEHLSEGSYNKQWINDTLKLHYKWKNQLPISIHPFAKKDVILTEKRNFRHFVATMSKNGFSKVQQLRILWQSGLHQLSFPLFIKLHISIFTNPYKNKN